MHDKLLQLRVVFVVGCLFTSNLLNIAIPLQFGRMVDSITDYTGGGMYSHRKQLTSTNNSRYHEKHLAASYTVWITEICFEPSMYWLAKKMALVAS